MTPGYPNGVYLRVFVQLDRFFEALQQWCNLGKVLGHVITFSTLKPCKATWSSRLYDNTSCLARNLAYNVFVQLYCVARFKVTLGQPGDLLYHKSLWLSGPDLLKANANHRARRPWSGKRKLAPPPPQKKTYKSAELWWWWRRVWQANASITTRAANMYLLRKKHGWHYHPVKTLAETKRTD